MSQKHAANKKTRDKYDQPLRLGSVYEVSISFFNPGRALYTYFPSKAKGEDKQKVVFFKEGKRTVCWRFSEYHFEGDKLVIEKATRKSLSADEEGLASLLLGKKGL